MIIKFSPSKYATPGTPDTPGRGKLADAELHFSGGPLNGLRLIGFAVTQRDGIRDVSFPSRQYSVNGDRRTIALLQPISNHQDQHLRDLILLAFAEFESELAHIASEVVG